jgi:hypothetical protein
VKLSGGEEGRGAGARPERAVGRGERERHTVPRHFPLRILAGDVLFGGRILGEPESRSNGRQKHHHERCHVHRAAGRQPHHAAQGHHVQHHQGSQGACLPTGGPACPHARPHSPGCMVGAPCVFRLRKFIAPKAPRTCVCARARPPVTDCVCEGGRVSHAHAQSEGGGAQFHSDDAIQRQYYCEWQVCSGRRCHGLSYSYSGLFLL